MPHQSLGRALYFVSFIDDSTRKVWAYPISTKDQVFLIFSEWLAMVEKQPTVTLSSTEAEYRGAAVAACEVVWLKRILKDLGIPIKDPTPLYCDNMSVGKHVPPDGR